MHKEYSVSIVRVTEQDTYAALERAISLISKSDEVIPPGSRVLVKPNIVMAPTERNITDPVVLEAVLRFVATTSPKEIIIAEGSADSYTTAAFRLYNIYDIASRYGARVVDLNLDDGVRTDVPPEAGRDYIMLPRTVVEAEFIISIPTFKLWMNDLPMSLSLKNLFGFYGARYYGHNKNSHELAGTDPERTLEGEVGTERGIHHPSVEQSIAAVNLARRSDLTILDALEGSDGKGNFLRMDLLMAGRNAAAVDTVALSAAGFVPEEQGQIRLCSQLGIGPCRLEDIEISGESLESVGFDLTRLNDNVLEMPLSYCLDRLTAGELAIIVSGLKLHGFIAADGENSTKREEMAGQIRSVIETDGYLKKALDSLPATGNRVLAMIIERGGTAGSFFDILHIYTDETGESNSFWAGLRSLMRLGLAYILHGQYKPYIILAEGVTEAADAKASLAASAGTDV